MRTISLNATWAAVACCRPNSLRFFILASFLLIFNALKAQDRGMYWKYKDYDGAVAVTMPRWAVGLGSLFIDKKDDRKLLRKVHKVRVLFFEENSPITSRDMNKFMRKARHRNLEELITVKDGATRVNIMAKERRGIIRKVVVFFASDEGSGLVSMKGRFNLKDLNKTLNKIKKSKSDNKPVLPDAVKVPVIRA